MHSSIIRYILSGLSALEVFASSVYVTLPLLAQTTYTSATDPLSGSSGWAGAGLLGLVLFWLLVIHLPAKDKQLTELVTKMTSILGDKDNQLKELLDKKWVMVQVLTEKYRENLEKITDHCQEEMKEVTSAHNQFTTRVIDYFKDLKVK